MSCDVFMIANYLYKHYLLIVNSFSEEGWENWQSNMRAICSSVKFLWHESNFNEMISLSLFKHILQLKQLNSIMARLCDTYIGSFAQIFELYSTCQLILQHLPPLCFQLNVFLCSIMVISIKDLHITMTNSTHSNNFFTNISGIHTSN